MASQFMLGRAYGAKSCVSSKIGVTALQKTLNFASALACTGTAGRITINQSSGATSTSGCIGKTIGVTQRASFRVKGGQGSGAPKVYIRIPSSVTINAGSIIKKMKVTNLLMNHGGGTRTYTINGNRTTTLDIGGQLNVSAGQATGNYQGIFSVTATCN